MKTRILESYPERIQARIETYQRKLESASNKSIRGNRFQLVIEDFKVWRIGTLKVSFKGGTTTLHKKIASAASEWSQYGNIKFDFGYSKKTKRYRTWKKNDSSHI